MKMLRHRNIQIVREPALYLRITTDTSKTVNRPVVTMENAVSIYEALLEDHKKHGLSLRLGQPLKRKPNARSEERACNVGTSKLNPTAALAQFASQL